MLHVYTCVHSGLNDYDPSIKADNLCPEGIEEGCTGDLTECCEPATCESAMPEGEFGYNCAAADLNDYDPSKSADRQCPGGLASGCQGDLTVCCEPATCASALPDDSSGFQCFDSGLNIYDPTVKAGVICPGGMADGCLNDLSVCCGAATCASANSLGRSFGCASVGLNIYDPNFNSGTICPGGTVLGASTTLLKGGKACPLGLASTCLSDQSVCCEAPTCQSAEFYNGRTGYMCASRGLGSFSGSPDAQGGIPCPSGTPDSCTPNWCCSGRVNCNNNCGIEG
uniref:Uncharacterized protein n=1 Tax=Chromera velia CCMP2878 TaxID=1169474 RepID=A0A0G4F3W5_9ALVE|eukprot:Cvel_2684.t1-p1 / transcript=Cvel_2684.t1 / gene=Cvel_2684 / organism=Chromera_velia_CCMP2878 / gene_product=Keratin-associated protein 5-1, putative / transcript_product=Keratin-associated protein 5-1, putative / location=Cvel_scaffold107:85463-87672(+) / protein_length=282 / sequence_SO=supercontig / SO=protein_coding / is_pseudo=false